MGIKLCKHCNTRMIGGLYPYKNPDWGNYSDVDKLPGYKCFNKECPNEGYIEFDEDVQKNVEQNVQLKKLLHQTKVADESPIKPILISKVKKARTDQDIQPKLIADVLGVTDQRYGAIERNSNTPNVFIALQLEKIMGADIHELYELVYIPTPLYEKLKILNTDFDVVPGIPERLELRNQIDSDIVSIKARLKERREEIAAVIKNELIEERKLTKKTLTTTEQRQKISKEVDKDEENLKLLAEIDKKLGERVHVRKQIDYLMGKEGKVTPQQLGLNIKKSDVEKQNFLLRLGYCIDYENWILVQKKYADELDKNVF
jgi:DNA-binding XRE family transcriptional regulator